MSELKSPGTKNDNGKPRISLIPKDAVWAIANGLTYGEKKYGTHNFRNGIQYSRLLDATFRHLTAWSEGEDIDPESGNNHLDHAGASLTMLIFMAKNVPSMDDRYKALKAPAEVVIQKPKPEKPFQIGDSVKTENSDIVMTVAGFFYDDENNLVMFVTDDAGRIYQADYRLYVRA